MQTKVCSHCGQEKPLLDFYRHPSGKDGRDSTCKECILRHKAEQRHAENKEQLKRWEERKQKRMRRYSGEPRIEKPLARQSIIEEYEPKEHCGNCKHLMYADPIGRGICGLTGKPKEPHGRRCKNWSN